MAADDLPGGERTEAVRRGASCRTASARAEAPSETDGAARAPAAPVRGRASGERGARTGGQAAWTGHVPPPAERERLAATLGAELRSLRAAHGLSIRRLAERSAVAGSTIVRLEHGERRPRPATLGALAYGLDPSRAGEIAARLAEAAGESLRPDTPGGIRRRQRRMAKARRAAQRETWRLARATNETRSEAFRLLMRTLRRLPLDLAFKPGLTPGELERALQRLAALTVAQQRADALFAARDELSAVLAAARHPLEVPRSARARRILNALNALDAEQ